MSNLINTLENEITKRAEHMSNAEILHAYELCSSHMSHQTTCNEEPVCDQTPCTKAEATYCTKIEASGVYGTCGKDENEGTGDPENVVPMEEEVKEEETPKPAKKKVAKKAAKKAAKTKKKEEPAEEVEQEEKSDSSDDDLDDVYEEVRDAYDAALNRGVQSDQFIDLIKTAGFSSIDDIEDIKVMIELRDATKKLKKA